jgi:prevent-host-death family protein
MLYYFTIGGVIMLNTHVNLKDALNRIISVSDLGRGKASKIIKNVEFNKESYIIVKNNKPKAVIMSIDEYNEMVESREKLELLLLSAERIKSNKQSEYVDYDDVLAEFNLTNKEIDKLQNSIEIE